MNKVPVWFRTVAVISGLAAASTVSATTGYFALGYGAKAMGLAGAVVSNPQDSATIAVNPAGITAIGERVDVGLRFFNPHREAELEHLRAQLSGLCSLLVTMSMTRAAATCS